MTMTPTDSDPQPNEDPRPSPGIAEPEQQAVAQDGSHAPRGRDRRRKPTPRFSRFSLRGGRRMDVRRTVERDGTYVDRYGSVMLAVVLWVSLMNLGDSFFTIRHLQHGGIELNPIAQELLKTGKAGFVLWKGLLIGTALMVLTLHKNFTLARMGLWLSAGGYTVLCMYHLYLYTV